MRRETGAEQYWRLMDPEAGEGWFDRGMLTLRTSAESGNGDSREALETLDTAIASLAEFAADAIDRLPGGPASVRQTGFAEPAQRAARHHLLSAAHQPGMGREVRDGLDAGYLACDKVLDLSFVVTASDFENYGQCLRLEEKLRARYPMLTWFDPETSLPAARFHFSGTAWVEGDEMVAIEALQQTIGEVVADIGGRLAATWSSEALKIRRPLWAHTDL